MRGNTILNGVTITLAADNEYKCRSSMHGLDLILSTPNTNTVHSKRNHRTEKEEYEGTKKKNQDTNTQKCQLNYSV